MCDSDPAREALCPVGGGHTKIYAPEEGLATADIDLSMIAYAKAAADPADHHLRSDVTRLLLNAKPRRPVMAFDETSGLAPDLAGRFSRPS